MDNVTPNPAPAAPESTAEKKNWFVRHKILTALLVLVVLAGLGSMFGGGDSDNSASSAKSASTSEENKADSADKKSEKAAKKAEKSKEQEVKIGEEFSSGDFLITVKELRPSQDQIGDEFLNKKAQGKFIQAVVSIKNNGQKKAVFFDNDVKLIDDQNREHSTSSDSFYLGDANLMLKDINPGNSVEGVLLFDVPQDATPTFLKFDTEWLAAPVKVALQ